MSKRRKLVQNLDFLYEQNLKDLDLRTIYIENYPKKFSLDDFQLLFSKLGEIEKLEPISNYNNLPIASCTFLVFKQKCQVENVLLYFELQGVEEQFKGIRVWSKKRWLELKQEYLSLQKTRLELHWKSYTKKQPQLEQTQELIPEQQQLNVVLITGIHNSTNKTYLKSYFEPKFPIEKLFYQRKDTKCQLKFSTEDDMVKFIQFFQEHEVFHIDKQRFGFKEELTDKEVELKVKLKVSILKGLELEKFK